MKVALFQHKDIKRAVRLALSEMDNLPTKDDRVLLKPNIVRPDNYPCCTLTEPIVVREIAKYLIKHGAKPDNITIGESAWSKATTEDGLRNQGFYDIGEELGIHVLNLFNTKPKTYEIPKAITFHKVRMSEWVMDEIDYIVSCAKLKVHRMALVTLGTKNLMGTIPTLKSWLHAKINTNIVDLANFLKPRLTVIDGSVGSEYAEIHGRPVEMNCIIASENVFSADRVGCMVMGINPDIVPYLQYVPKESKDVEIVGNDWRKVRKDFELPFTMKKELRCKNVRNF